MRKIKVSEATVLQLDWLMANLNEVVVAVNKSLPNYPYLMVGDFDAFDNRRFVEEEEGGIRYSPSTIWDHMGPLIDREKIGILHLNHGFLGPVWSAGIGGGSHEYGPTPLIAAARCYITSKLGEEVEIPEELYG